MNIVKYNRLTLLEHIRGSKAKSKWLCDCGSIVFARIDGIKSGSVKSCGCYQRETAGPRFSKALTKHGMSMPYSEHYKIYLVWNGMISRCYNKNKERYSDWGGRGIEVCEEWRDGPVVFKDWCLQNGYQDGLQIDRIDNEKGYSPENCRFVTVKNNALNRRNSVIIEYRGVKKGIEEWASMLGINRACLYSRLTKSKMSVEEAFSYVKK